MTDNLPLLATTAAPELFANGLHDVEVMGSVARFVMFSLKREINGDLYKDVPFTVILPVDAVGPAIALTMKRLTSGLVVPAFEQATKQLLRLN